MIEQFVNFVIRPPRSEYNPDQYLWEKEFILAGRKYKRLDLELTNARGYILKCSHYVPAFIPENTALPCVVYCHGNSGCRADANEAAVILLPSNITVFTLDFSGSGLSGGDYVSLGWHEKEDLKCAVSCLRDNKQVSTIGLWGRSMGAVTCLLYGAEDPSIGGMILDSAFTNLYDLMMELVDVYKIRVPKFTGDKNIIKFDGDHNSPRPQSYYDSVSIFFYKSLHPPLLPAARSKLHMGAFKVGNITNENFFFEIINGLRPANTAGCSSSTDAPNIPHDGTSVIELLSDSMNQLSIKNENHLLQDFLLDENHSLPEIDSDSVGSRLQDKRSRRNEESFSFTSSNRESWGRCSSLGAASDESFSGDNNDKQNLTVKALATPVRQNQRQSQRKPIEKAKQKKIQALWKKIKREKVEMGDSLSSRLKMCLGQSPQHKRNRSSGTITTS
ncbi:uncharacterized isoform X6 [Zea mays]|uniref:Serine aminopeptidase S33 domain-containing protein n=1 Tax=Zea mays TaxID=4577 RepID=A0A804PH98_MAIZE|nr:uncharacterized protein LOC100383953 isoform X6 [Zea mays]|eukprot:XP_020393053.1 uncharacterized LOC100383953 isoform X5 [Zea mays]